jgi:hypothetical protein
VTVAQLKIKILILFTFICWTGPLVGQTFSRQVSDSLIKNFLTWIIKPGHFDSHNCPAQTCKVDFVSSKIVEFDKTSFNLSLQTIKEEKFDLVFSEQDITFMTTQQKDFNQYKTWNSRIFSFNYVNPDMLPDSNTDMYWELSFPLFTINKQYCIAISNIACKEDYYCFVKYIAVFQRQANGNWAIMKEIKHTEY